MNEARVASCWGGWSTVVRLIVFVVLMEIIVDRFAPPWLEQPTAEPTAVLWDHYVTRFPDPDKWLLPTPASRQALPPADPASVQYSN